MFYYKDQTRNYDPEAYEKHPILSYMTVSYTHLTLPTILRV